MIKLLYIPYLTLASRFHGGGFISAPRWVRNSVFALAYAVLMYPCLYISTLAFIFAFIGKNVGHEDFWMMGQQLSVNNKDNILTKYLVRPTGLKPYSLAWCWLGMSLKGLLTSLGTLNPLLILGHIIALPFAYFISRRLTRGSELAEYLSGFLYGIVVVLVYEIK